MNLLRLLCSLPLIAFTGCTSFLSASAAARAQFSADVTCPAARVRADHAPTPAPSPEIATDGERLALWNQQHRDAPLYVASGCGQDRRYTCIAYGPYPYHYDCTSR